ncbi:hypothetical protein FOL46_001091 [Perkinsus olseni]|uniref:DUF8003 domain-containing protein n=1 Tax=Perkinsus olseni TaxID=32597 RepID=A0A7J6MVM2_PEROL|nr:hypothetical protein FOL46_001091 [Perkinsus olseni]
MPRWSVLRLFELPMLLLRLWLIFLGPTANAASVGCDVVVDGACVLNSTRPSLPSGAELVYKGNGSVRFINATWRCSDTLLVEAANAAVDFENSTISNCMVLTVVARQGNITLDEASLLNATATVYDDLVAGDDTALGGSLGGAGGALGLCDRGDRIRGIDYTVVPENLAGEGTAPQCGGGGRITLTSNDGHVTFEGSIEANGGRADAGAKCGAGSGGVVVLRGALGVTAGKVHADGGDCGGNLGCGGGGRIFVASDNGTVSVDDARAYGGRGGEALPDCLCGSPGTVYQKDANGALLTVRGGHEKCGQTTVLPQEVRSVREVVVEGNITVRLCGDDDGNSCLDGGGGGRPQVAIAADQGVLISGGAKLSGPPNSPSSSMVLSVGNIGLKVAKESSIDTEGSLSILAATATGSAGNGGNVILEKQSLVSSGKGGMKISTQGDVDAGGSIVIRSTPAGVPAIAEDSALTVNAAGSINLSDVVSNVEGRPVMVSAGEGLRLGSVQGLSAVSDFRTTWGDVVIAGNVTMGPGNYCKQRKLWIENPLDLCVADMERLGRLMPTRMVVTSEAGGIRFKGAAVVSGPIVMVCSPRGALELPPQGWISSTGRGCPAGEGRGGGGPGRDGHCGGGGGAHVGSGGPGCDGNQGVPYDEQDPLETGVIPSASASGGGGEEGGSGGGVVWISAAQLRIDGHVSSDGDRGGWTVGDTSGSGGGAGGSVLIITNTSLAGSGLVSAAAGNGSGPPVLKGGDGGGGFVGIGWLGSAVGGGGDTFSGRIDVGGHQPGSVGQILRCPAGHYGPLCAPCPRGTWSDTGGPRCAVCSNAPRGVSNYTEEGVEDSNCPYACLPGYPDVSQNPTCLNPWQYTLSFIGGVPGAFTLLVVVLFALLASIATSEIRKRSGDGADETVDSGEWKIMTADDIPRHVARLYLQGRNDPREPFVLPSSLGDLPRCIAELINRQHWSTFSACVNEQGKWSSPPMVNLWGRWTSSVLSVACYPLWLYLSRSQQEQRARAMCEAVFEESGKGSLWRVNSSHRAGRIFTIRFGCDGGRDGSFTKSHMDVLDLSVRVEHWESNPKLPALLRLAGDGSYMSPLRVPHPGWDPMASALAVFPQDVTGWMAFAAHVNDALLPMTFHDGLVPPAELTSICAGVRRASDTFLVPSGVKALVVVIPDHSGDYLAAEENHQPRGTSVTSVDSGSSADPFLGEYSSFQQMTSVEHAITAGSSRFSGFCKPCQIGLVMAVSADDVLVPPYTSDRPLYLLRAVNPALRPTSPLDLSAEFSLEEIDIHEYSFRWEHSTSASNATAGLARILWSPVRVSLRNRRPNERVVTMSRVALQASVIVLLFIYATLTAMQLTWFLGMSPLAFVVQLAIPPLGDLLALTLGAVWVVLSYTPWARWFVCFVVATFVNSLTGFAIRLTLSSTGSLLMVITTLAIEYLIVIAVKVCLCVTSNMLLAHHLNHSYSLRRPSTPASGEAREVLHSRSATPPTPRYMQFPSRDFPMPPPSRAGGAVPQSIVAEMRDTGELSYR